MDLAVLKRVLGLKDEATEADIIATITTAKVTQQLRAEPRRVISSWDEMFIVTGLHRSQIKELEAKGKFPRGFKLTANKKIWFADDVKRWQDQRVAAADRDDDQSDRGAERAIRRHQP
jgi:predicted DNA-binding transcriptional regulator AlpA